MNAGIARFLIADDIAIPSLTNADIHQCSTVAKLYLLFISHNNQSFSSLYQNVQQQDKSKIDPSAPPLSRGNFECFRYIKQRLLSRNGLWSIPVISSVKVKFNAAIWTRTKSTHEVKRYEMLKDLIDSELLIGKNRSEVRAFLGTPMFITNTNPLADTFPVAARPHLSNSQLCNSQDSWLYFIAVNYDKQGRALCITCGHKIPIFE